MKMFLVFVLLFITGCSNRYEIKSATNKGYEYKKEVISKKYRVKKKGKVKKVEFFPKLSKK